MTQLKDLGDLPEAQQKALEIILRLKKPAFYTSEFIPKMDEAMNGRSVGGVLGSLYRNGYLEKVQGGRDKKWKLSAEAEKLRNDVRLRLNQVKQYWS
jgi:hypothetical protein